MGEADAEKLLKDIKYMLEVNLRSEHLQVTGRGLTAEEIYQRGPRTDYGGKAQEKPRQIMPGKDLEHVSARFTNNLLMLVEPNHARRQELQEGLRTGAISMDGFLKNSVKPLMTKNPGLVNDLISTPPTEMLSRVSHQDLERRARTIVEEATRGIAKASVPQPPTTKRPIGQRLLPPPRPSVTRFSPFAFGFIRGRSRPARGK